MNQYIDHTLLKSNATESELKQLCQEAKDYEFKSVCINPGNIEYCEEQLKGTEVEICTVIGFPLGATTTAAKRFETQDAIDKGASEIDMVINIGKLIDNDLDYVENEIRQIKQVTGIRTLKVIIETCLLTDEQKVNACRCAINANADFVKTSTGFSTGGATVEDVQLMKKTVGDKAQVKASGGVRSYEDLKAMIDAGATRIGTSSGVKLVQGDKEEGNY